MESIVFYKSFYIALSRLSPLERGEGISALLAYAFDGIEYEGNNNSIAMLLDLAKPQLDANLKRREDGKKGAIYGSKGGRPRKNPIGVMDKNPIGVISETPNDNVNDNVNDNIKENIIINNNIKEKSFHFGAELKKLGVSEELIEEWLRIRHAKKAVNSEFTLKHFLAECEKANVSAFEAVEICCKNQWRGFKAEYLKNKKNTNIDACRIVQAGIALSKL